MYENHDHGFITIYNNLQTISLTSRDTRLQVMPSQSPVMVSLFLLKHLSPITKLRNVMIRIY